MFSKLFDSMYDGTLRTRAPWQALVTFQQMLILCDPTGVCDMAPEAIAFRTGIPLEIILAGIAALEAPDPDSRLPNDEGRRIALLDEHRNWGWQITNFLHYRGLQSNEERREYQRKWQRNRRGATKDAAGGKGASTNDDTCRQLKTPVDDVVTRNVSAFSSGFPEFWLAYPRKVTRKEALKAWERLKPDDALRSKIHAAVQTQKETWLRNGTLPKHIPHASTWLNGERWEDEIQDARQQQRVIE